MIDTDKYEGHTPAEHWSFSLWGFSMPTGFDADAQLIADAPLLLEEVKRLRKDFKGLGKSLKQQLLHCEDKEMIGWIIEKIQEMIR